MIQEWSKQNAIPARREHWTNRNHLESKRPKDGENHVRQRSHKSRHLRYYFENSWESRHCRLIMAIAWLKSNYCKRMNCVHIYSQLLIWYNYAKSHSKFQDRIYAGTMLTCPQHFRVLNSKWNKLEQNPPHYRVDAVKQIQWQFTK